MLLSQLLLPVDCLAPLMMAICSYDRPWHGKGHLLEMAVEEHCKACGRTHFEPEGQGEEVSFVSFANQLV